MTFEQVLAWCRANGANVRGVYRGKDILIAHTDERLPNGLPSLGEIFHWDLKVGDLHHAASASDLERMVTGKLTIEGFKGTLRGGG
jgi:hypothetical protein